MICECALMYSRRLGFLEYTEEGKEMFKPVLQRLVRTIRSTAANRCTCHRMLAAPLA
jgi:hypothetical protein